MSIPRTEFLGNNAVNIGDNSQVFAQKIAEMKNAQGDNLPFYVMNTGSVISALNRWFYYLPRISPFYSVKCNNDGVLLRLLAAHPNVGLSCSNRRELETAMDFIPSGRILYANHLLTNGVLRNAAESGVGLLAIETLEDLQKIQKIFPQANMILNIAVSKDSEDPGVELGCTVADAREILEQAAIAELNIRGISFNIGAGARDPRLYTSAIQTCSDLFKFGTSAGLKMDIINIGGGFFNGTLESYSDCAPFTDICSAINSALDYYFPLDAIPDLRVIAQPGRFFAADAYTLSTCIIGKEAVDLSDATGDDYFQGTPSYIYQINEGFYGAFACRMTPFCNPKCTPLFEAEDDHFSSRQYYGNIVGPTTDTFDVAQTMCHLRQMEVGEWLSWPKMGAYSFNTRANLDGLDIPPPAIYYYCDNADWQVIQRLLTLESNARPKSIASTQLTSRRSSAAMSVLEGASDEDESYGSISDIWEVFSCSNESLALAEGEWMGQYQEPIFD